MTTAAANHQDGQPTWLRVPGVPVGLFSQKDDMADVSDKETPQNSFQFVVNAMFSSCTSIGAQYRDSDSFGDDIRKNETGSRLSNPQKSSRTFGTTITPASSADERMVTPSPRHKPKVSRPTVSARVALQESSKNLFKNNHEIAEEAIKHLRQQQHKDAIKQKLNENMYAPSIGMGSEREILSHNHTISSTLQAEPSLVSQVATKASKVSSRRNAVRARQEHSFFPASRPRDAPGGTRKEQRAREKKERIKGVPKEVSKTSSPVRVCKTNYQKQQGLSFVSRSTTQGWDAPDNGDAETSVSWDMDNDGISDITQVTVDRMIFAVKQQLLVFPEEAETLNRIHSDVTDPIPNRHTSANNNSGHNPHGALIVEAPSSKLFGAMSGFAKSLNVVTPPRIGDGSTKGMTPPSFTRNAGSMGTHSFFTKTTNSSQTSNFASAWRRDEQQFWETEVAKDGKTTSSPNPVPGSPLRQNWAKFPKTKQSGATTTTTSITTATTPTLASPKTQSRTQLSNHEETEFFLANNNRLMDSLILQNEVEMAEI